jgi:hypothetical protein
MKTKLLIIPMLLIMCGTVYSQTIPTVASPVTSVTYNTDVKIGIKVLKEEVVDYDYVITYIDSNDRIKSYSKQITYRDPKMAQIVNKTVFDQDEKTGFKVINAEVEDNLYAITYFDANGILKKYQNPITASLPYVSTSPLLVAKDIYDTDVSKSKFKRIKAEVDENYFVTTYFDESGILKQYKEPLSADSPHILAEPLVVNSGTYNNDATGKKIIKSEVEDFYYVITYFDANGVLKKYQKPITSTTPYEFVTPPVYASKIEYENDGKGPNFNLVSAEIKDYYWVRTYFKGDILKIYQSPIEKTSYVTTLKYGFAGFSLLTVPFKIRPATEDTSSFSRADIDNIGLFSGYSWSWERWHYDDTKTTFKIAVGGYLAASVEELTTTNSSVTKDTSQCYLTTAFAVTLNWNKLNFAIIPIGVDTGFSDTSKKWIYNGNIWWGFGIGIDTSLFQF